MWPAAGETTQWLSIWISLLKKPKGKNMQLPAHKPTWAFEYRAYKIPCLKQDCQSVVNFTISQQFKCNHSWHRISKPFTMEVDMHCWFYYLPSKTWFRILQALSTTSGECECFLIISKTFICMPFARSVFLIFTKTQNIKHPVSKSFCVVLQNNFFPPFFLICFCLIKQT